MKNFSLLLLVMVFTFSSNVHATDWLTSLKNLVGLGDNPPVEQTLPSTSGLVENITQSLNVSNEQASGGLGAIFNYVKGNVNAEQFKQLGAALPGVNSLLSKMPAIGGVGSSGALGGLLDKVAEQNDTLKAISDVKKQFDALGLKPEMISQFITQAQSYLDTEQGQEAKQLLMQGVGKLLG